MNLLRLPLGKKRAIRVLVRKLVVMREFRVGKNTLKEYQWGKDRRHCSGKVLSMNDTIGWWKANQGGGEQTTHRTLRAVSAIHQTFTHSIHSSEYFTYINLLFFSEVSDFVAQLQIIWTPFSMSRLERNIPRVLFSHFNLGPSRVGIYVIRYGSNLIFIYSFILQLESCHIAGMGLNSLCSPDWTWT